MTRYERIENLLQSELHPQYMELENESHQHSVPDKSETHFRLVLVSNQFIGLSRLDRQRHINQILQQELQSGLHALSQRLYTSEEWDQVKDHFQMQSPLCTRSK